MANSGYDLMDAWEAMEFQELGQRNLLQFRGKTATHAQFGSIGADGSGHLTMPYAIKPSGLSKDQVIAQFGSIDGWVASSKDNGSNSWSRSAYYQMLESSMRNFKAWLNLSTKLTVSDIWMAKPLSALWMERRIRRLMKIPIILQL